MEAAPSHLQTVAAGSSTDGTPLERQHSFGKVWKVSSPTDLVRCSARECSEILGALALVGKLHQGRTPWYLPSFIINRDLMLYTGQLNSQLFQGAAEGWAQAQRVF